MATKSVGSIIDDEYARLRQTPASSIGSHHGRRRHHHSQQQQQQQSSTVIIGKVPEESGIPAPLISRQDSANRNYWGKISGSMRSFAACPDSASTTITSPWSVQYRPAGTDIGDPRCGNPERTYLLGAKLVWVYNPFPVSVFLSSDAFRGNCYGPGKQRGFFVIPPKGKISWTKPRPIFLPSPNLLSKVVQLYGHCTEESIDTGVVNMGDGNYLITPGTPLCNVIKINENNPKFPYSLDSMLVTLPSGDKRYMISKYIYESADDCFRRDILPKLPHIDGSRICIQASRAGEPWDAPLQMFSGDSGESCDTLLASMSGSIEFLLEIEYRLVHT